MLLPAKSFRDESCDAVVANEEAGLLLVRVRGRYTAATARDVIRAMSRALDQRPLSLFADFGDLGSYESDARTIMTNWCIDHRGAIVEMHALAKNGLVRMGIATAAMTLSLVGLRLNAHSDRDVFEALYRRRISLRQMA